MATQMQPPLRHSISFPSHYAPEPCGNCRCTGYDETGLCAACDGKKLVLVRQPSLVCPRCHGIGKATDYDRVQYFTRLCLICQGTGWVMTLDESDSD